MRLPIVLLVLVGCQADTAAVAVLEERVEVLQSRLEVVEATRTSTIAPAPEISAALAPAEAAPRPTPNSVVRVGVDRGGVTVDGVRVATDALDAILRAAAQRPGLTGVVVDAALDVDQASLLAVLDRIKASGLGKVAIATHGGAAPEPALAADDDPLTAR